MPMGSIAVAGWLARVGFVALIAVGIWSGELRRTAAIIFVAAGLAAWIGLPRIENGALFVTPVLAVLDIALVLLIFKGDVRIG
jgi:hypothetical protein